MEPLVAALKHEDRDVREAAAEALGQIGAPAVEPLVAALSSWDVHAAAAQALDRLEWRPDYDEAGAAYWVAKGEWDECMYIGAPAVPPLIAALKGGDRDVRRHATKALGQLGRLAVEPLMASFKDKSVRRYAIEALGQIGDAAVPTLIAAVKNGDQDVLGRVSAAEALGQIGAPAVGPLIDAVKDGDQGVRRYAARALGHVGASAVEPLIATLKDGDQDVLGRVSAAEALVNVGTPAVEPLLAAMADGDECVRRYAARGLGRIGDARAVDTLIAALKDRDQDVRKSATDALVKIGAPAVDALIAALKGGDQDVRKYAARALVKIGDARAVDTLISRLKDEDQGVRRYAVEALGHVGAAAVGPLIAALQDRDMSKYAARALGRIGDPRSVEPLMAAFKDQSVRRYATEALVEIGAPAVPGLIAAFKDHGVRKYATEALVEIGAPAVPGLIAAFKDGDRDVREYAAGALGRVGDPRARKLLRAARSDPDECVRKVAREGLAGQVLADKLLCVQVGMTEEALTGLLGRPALARSVATSMGGSSVSSAAVSDETLEQERWVFETEFGYFLVVMRHGRVAELLTGGMLDRLRPTWRTQGTQSGAWPVDIYGTETRTISRVSESETQRLSPTARIR